MTGCFSKKDLLFFRNFRSEQISDVALRPPLLIAQTVGIHAINIPYIFYHKFPYIATISYLCKKIKDD